MTEGTHICVCKRHNMYESTNTVMATKLRTITGHVARMTKQEMVMHFWLEISCPSACWDENMDLREMTLKIRSTLFLGIFTHSHNKQTH